MIKNVALRACFVLCMLIISCSKDDNEVPDTTPPSVDFTIKGITQDLTQTPVIGNTIEIEISAQDAKGISKVEAFMNDVKVGEDNQPPFQITIDLTQYSKKLTGKGTALNKTQTQYTLKVSATDLAGNVTSIERDIIVDNELPTVTEVTLENNAVITGEENPVTFKANDNESIMSLEVKVNNVSLEATALENNTYTFNINTALLEEGPNNLTITATDQASNTVIYSAPFVVDNSGPEINLEGLSSDDIIDEVNTLTIGAEDSYSEVTSLKIYVNDDLILSSEDGTELSLDLNPDDYPTGDASIRIDATDALGNESTLEIDFQIKRLLLTINVPNGFLNPYISKFYVFASSSSGELLDIKPLEFNTSSIRLSTLEDIAHDDDYMVNFAYFFNGGGGTSIIKTIQNVKRTSLSRIDLKVPESKSGATYNTYQISTFPDVINIVGEGTDYNSSWDPQNQEYGFRIEEQDLAYTNATSNQHYIYYHNQLNNNYGYQLVSKPVPGDFILDYNNFTTDGVETRYINGSAMQDPDKSSSLMLYGYLTANDLQNNMKHRIWGHGYQNIMSMSGNGLRYSFNTIFHEYNYQLTMENYHVEAMGEPLSYYDAPNWSIDYTYSSSTKSFTLTKTGTSHNIGKITMDKFENNSHYTWTVLFDSQATSEVVLPKLPSELQSWNINSYYTTGNLTTEQIEVKRYDGLNSYDAFLQSVIKNNEYNQHNVTEKIESIFKSNVGAYSSRPDFLLN